MRILALVLVLALGAAMTAPAIAADAKRGSKIFKKCAACHKVGPKAKNSLGPVLNGVFERPFGAIEGFKYSDNLLELAAEGRIWDVETLNAYLTRPKDVIPKGSMAFAGLRKERDREDVIAHLMQFNEQGEIVAEENDGN